VTAESTQNSIALAEGEGERISFGGVEILFKAEDPWTVLDYSMPAKQFGAPLHYHNRLIESFYVLTGELWMRLGDQELILKPGSFALAAPGTPHSFANNSEAPVRFLAHASHSDHKRFLCELLKMAQEEPVWPPADGRKVKELGARYDTVYL
jgi:mannose-6-phosphate isomerase-like protein (cupin superfamily)